MDDKRIQDLIDIDLARVAGGEPVAARVAAGVVTLTGVVRDDMRRIVIEQELLRHPEVLDVRNHLHVAEPLGDIRTRLLVLLEREDVPTDGLKVAERDGVVTLSGTVAGWFDRDAAERLAWSVEGVRAVENRIQLPVGAVRPDAP
ncbi:BON domain-containing protein [Phenylobacterium sp.]|uniref:BON domain-containing protein n=1 Tax=Phenylobacterium sp. TaxID=1871053 RepID=UPI00391AD094